MRVRIRLVRSAIGELPRHRRTIKALGLRKVNQAVEKEGTPAILGMARAVAHLVTLEELK